MEEEQVRKVLKEEFNKRKKFIASKQIMLSKKDRLEHNTKRSSFRFLLLLLMVAAIIFAFVKIFF